MESFRRVARKKVRILDRDRDPPARMRVPVRMGGWRERRSARIAPDASEKSHNPVAPALCVCERERERERVSQKQHAWLYFPSSAFICPAPPPEIPFCTRTKARSYPYPHPHARYPVSDLYLAITTQTYKTCALLYCLLFLAQLSGGPLLDVRSMSQRHQLLITRSSPSDAVAIYRRC